MTSILVKPPQLRSTAASLHNSAKAIRASMESIDQMILAFDPSRFQGATVDEIRQRYTRLKAALQDFDPLVQNFATELETVANRFEAADKSLNG